MCIRDSLYYNTGVGTAKYNGSISSMIWKFGNESTVRGYEFTYDDLDRVLNATYGETSSISTNANPVSYTHLILECQDKLLIFKTKLLGQ